MELIRIAAGVAAALAGPALAASAGKAPADPNRQICKSKPAIGSRLQRIRECHSAAEWQEMERAERLGLSSKQFNGFDGQGENEYKIRGGSADPR